GGAGGQGAAGAGPGGRRGRRGGGGAAVGGPRARARGFPAAARHPARADPRAAARTDDGLRLARDDEGAAGWRRRPVLAPWHGARRRRHRRHRGLVTSDSSPRALCTWLDSWSVIGPVAASVALTARGPMPAVRGRPPPPRFRTASC